MEGCECRGESLTITNIYLFHVSFHLCIRFVTNGKNGAFYSSAKCSTKWKSLKERYTQIRENLRKDPKGRRTPWAFYEKMHHLCGENDRNTLDYVQDVGACGNSSRKNKQNFEQESRFQRKKKPASQTQNS